MQSDVIYTVLQNIINICLGRISGSYILHTSGYACDYFYYTIYSMCELVMCKLTDPSNIQGRCGYQKLPRCSQQSVQVYLQ